MSKWAVVLRTISETIHHYRFVDVRDDKPLSFGEAIRLWSDDSDQGVEFRELTTDTIAVCPFKAFKWETPFVDTARLSRDFEFVLLSSPGLDRRQNVTAFLEHFKSALPNQRTLQFPNLGRNAVMIVPTPTRHSSGPSSRRSSGSMPALDSERDQDAEVNHCHLGSFLRSASRERTNDFWFTVGEAMTKRVSTKPVWLSTAGGGVAWLHARLDDRPKYYGYSPFKAN